MGGPPFAVGESVFVKDGKCQFLRGTIVELAKRQGRNYTQFVIQLDGSNEKVTVNRNSFDRILSNRNSIKGNLPPRTSHEVDSDSDSDYFDLENEDDKEEDDDYDDYDYDYDKSVSMSDDEEEFEEPVPAPAISSNAVEWKSQREIISNLEGPSSHPRPTIRSASPCTEPIDFFRLFFPMPAIEDWVKWTNKNIESDSHATGGKVAAEDLLKWMGMRLQMILLRYGSTDFYWAEKDDEDSLYSAPCFRVTRGYSKHRFETIERNVQFGKRSETDKWAGVRPLVDEFNKRRLEVFSPGRYLNLDESISMWYGSADKEDPSSCPHIAYIPGKPREQGILFKCSSCAESKIMLHLEIQGGKDEGPKLFEYQSSFATYHQSAFRTELYQKHTALSLRLVRDYFGTNRVCVMDSHFASVSTSRALKNHGLESIGMVKTNTTDYCMAECKDWFAARSRDETNPIQYGEYKAFIANFPKNDGTQFPLAALAVSRKKKLNTLISSVGSTVATKPLVLKRRRNGETKEISLPNILTDYFEYAKAIDNHNQLRQHLLNPEEGWVTRSYELRFFATFLGICVVDSYYGYRYQMKLSQITPGNSSSFSSSSATFPQPLTFLEFCHKLSLSLCPKLPTNQDAVQSPAKDTLAILSEHKLVPFTEEQVKCGRLRCRICHTQKSSFYCLGCSDLQSDPPTFYPVHSNEKDCYQEHLKQKLQL